MNKSLALLALLVIGAGVYLALGPKRHESVREELTLEQAAPATGEDRSPAELEGPGKLPADLDGAGQRSRKLVLDRSDASTISAARVKVTVRGITVRSEKPVLLRSLPLGVADATRSFELTGDGEFEFDVTAMSRAQPFALPTMNLTVDHPEYFIWDEMVEAEVVDEASRSIEFRASIVLEPLRATFAGQVWVPVGHEESIQLALFAIDKRSGKLDSDYIVQEQCDEQGRFRFRAEDPNRCVLVAHSDGLRAASISLDAPPGTKHENITLSLEPGSSISGRASFLGKSLAEGSWVRAVSAGPSSRSFRVGEAWFDHDAEKQRFYVLSVSVQCGPGGAFQFSGLDETEYRLQYDRREIGKVRAPATDVQASSEH